MYYVFNISFGKEFNSMIKETSSKTPSKFLAVQHNQLITARYNFSVAEQRLILYMISMIHKDDKDFQQYQIRIQDFIDIVGTSAKNEHQRAMEVTRKLQSKVLEIQEGNDVLHVNVISHARYKKGEGYVEVSFSPELKPYLLELQANFTALDIRNLFPLQSKYSCRLYPIFKRYRKLGKWSISVEMLRQILKIPATSYKLYGSFKQRVLEPVIEEINEHTDIKCSLIEEKKLGRKVAELVFKLETQASKQTKELPITLEVTQSKQVKDIPPQVSTPKIIVNNEVVEIMGKEFGITTSQATDLLSAYGEEQVTKALEYVRRACKTKEIGNLSAYTVTAIKNGYEHVETEQEKQKKETAERYKKLRLAQDNAEKEREEKEDMYTQVINDAVAEFVEKTEIDDVFIAKFEAYISKKSSTFLKEWYKDKKHQLETISDYWTNKDIPITVEFKKYINIHYFPRHLHSVEAWETHNNAHLTT